MANETPAFIPDNTATSRPAFIPDRPAFIPHIDAGPDPLSAASGATSIGARSGVTSWFEDLQGDIRNASGATWPGRFLQALGFKGLDVGSQAGAGEFMGGPLIGPAKVGTGLARAGRALTQPSPSPDLSSLVTGTPPKSNRGSELVRAGNEVVSGVLQTPGPFTGAVLGPEGLAQLPLYSAGAQVAQRGLEATGMSPDASELTSNLLTLLAGIGVSRRNLAARRAAARTTDTPVASPVASAPIDPVNAPLSLPTLPEALANASGESGASLEAISRAASERSQGISRVRIDTRSGRETPLVGSDAVDVRPGAYDRIVQRYPDGREITLDEGPNARPNAGFATGTPVFPLVGRELPGPRVGVYDLGEINAAVDPQALVQKAGLVYKGELVPGSGVHMFEDAAHPGKTAALKASYITSPEQVRAAMNAKLEQFGVGPSAGVTGPVSSAATPTSAQPVNIPGVLADVRKPGLIQRAFEKWADVRAHDPEIGDALQQLDNASKYFRTKAQGIVGNILGFGPERLSPEQERLFTLLADADSRQNLRANHPEEFQAAMNDPAIRSALDRYRPYEQDLTAAREALGGKTLEGDYLARIYEDHTGERLPGTGQRRIGIVNENAPYAPERTATAEYFYQNGTHQLEPSFVPKFVATNLRLLRDQLVQNFTEKATKLEPGQKLPDTIQYAGREYQKPDLTPGAKPSPTDYSVFDTPDDSKRAWGRFIGPKAVVDALRNYDPVQVRSAAKLGPVRAWMQKQVLLGGAGIPHAFNILRRVAAEAPLGVADPRGWINAAKVTFNKELRARGLQGLNDPTFDALARNGAMSAEEVSELKKYWGGNLNPLKWAEVALKPGKKLLFEPGSLGGLGGLDQRARVWLADRIRAEYPSMSDAAIAREVNTTLGSYNRANWTEFQKKLGYFLLFPGWDTSSMHYVLQHPIKSSIAPAFINLVANQTLARLGKQKDPNDATDPFSVHVGDHSLSSPLTREAMAVHLMRPIFQAATEVAHGRPDAVQAGGRQAFKEGLHVLRPDLSGLVALASSAAGFNLPGATVYNQNDVLTPGKVLPNKALDKVAAFTILKTNPLADRLVSGDTSHLEQRLRLYESALNGDKDALKQVARSAFYQTVGSVGVYDYQRDAEMVLNSHAGISRLMTQWVSQTARNNPAQAEKLLSDPQNAALVAFAPDFAQLKTALKEIDSAMDRATTPTERAHLETARKGVLASAEMLNNEFAFYEQKRQIAEYRTKSGNAANVEETLSHFPQQVQDYIKARTSRPAFIPAQ